MTIVTSITIINFDFVVSANEESTGEYYFAQEETFDLSDNGWKDFVVVYVEDGVIEDVYWSGTNIVPQTEKYITSKNGNYGMYQKGLSSSPWYQQADAMTSFIIENQSTSIFSAYRTDSDGHTNNIYTDTGTSVSIATDDLFDLVDQALESDPIEAGDYVLGNREYVIYGENEIDEGGWITKGNFIIVNGTIVDVFFNQQYASELNDVNTEMFNQDLLGNIDANNGVNRYELSLSENDESIPKWSTQIDNISQYVEENQEFDVEYTSDTGKTNDIYEVIIPVKAFSDVFDNAFTF
jgi:hypothetical protein